MRKPHDVIYLTQNLSNLEQEIYWCQDKIDEADIKYIRADLVSHKELSDEEKEKAESGNSANSDFDTVSTKTTHGILTQEPVAWFKKDNYGIWQECWDCSKDPNGIPLYTHPHKELSDEEILKISDRPELCDENNGLRSVIDFARAIIKASRGEE